MEELLTGHPGIVQMKEMAGPYLSWTNIDQEIKQAVRSCGSCQQVRKPPAVAPLTPWLWSSNPWYRVHITLRTKMGITLLSLTHILAGLMIYFVRRNISATTTIAILRELFAKYGLPVHCVIENSPQFRSEELSTRHQSYRAVGIWPAVGQR